MGDHEVKDEYEWQLYEASHTFIHPRIMHIPPLQGEDEAVISLFYHEADNKHISKWNKRFHSANSEKNSKIYI